MGEILKRERPCIPMNDTPVQNEEYGIHDERAKAARITTLKRFQTVRFFFIVLPL